MWLTAIMYGAALETSLMSVKQAIEGKYGLARLNSAAAGAWMILAVRCTL